MGRDLATVAAEGVEACVHGDRPRATQLVAELITALDLTHAGARPVCDLYEEALVELAKGRFDAARALFQALRTV
jgi:hypothetical protein